jgi:rod shape-determining protein MreD
MSIDVLGKNLLYLVVLALLQILIFNKIGITSMDVVPAFFLLFVLFLPFETPRWIILLLSFIIGISIDIFSDTYGLCASSTVFIGYIRPAILRYLAPRGGYDAGAMPRVRDFGIAWFAKYSLFLIFSHQFVFYFLENFGFRNFLYVLIKVLIGSIFSFLLIFISQFILYRKK